MNDSLRVFDNIGYEDFKRLASDNTLSSHEKIGFPNSFRENKEKDIFKDITSKLPQLNQYKKTVVDIGSGCGQLTRLMIQHCELHDHRLILIDSQEMLAQLPESPAVTKIPGCFPQETKEIITELNHQVDIIVCYSVLHYIFQEGNLFAFFDATLSLLKNNSELLIGDIPNHSMRQRFFSSPTGIAFHQKFMQTTDLPSLEFNNLVGNKMDDSIILSLLLRARNQGFNAYIVPQHCTLPMANRREDLLICKP